MKSLNLNSIKESSASQPTFLPFLSDATIFVVLEADTAKYVEWFEGAEFAIFDPLTNLIPYYTSFTEQAIPTVNITDGTAPAINISGMRRGGEAGFWLRAADALNLSIRFYRGS